MSFESQVPNSLLSTGDELLLSLARKGIQEFVDEMCHKDVIVGRLRKRTERHLKLIGEKPDLEEVYQALLKRYEVQEKNLRPIIRQRLWWLIEAHYNYTTGVTR